MTYLYLLFSVFVGASLWVGYYLRQHESPPTPPPPPTPDPDPPVIPDESVEDQQPTTSSLTPTMLETFCIAIRDFEGNPGDANYKNNNPGNFRCSPVGYLPKYGHVRCSPAKFAIFPTYELGWEYLENSVHYCAALHPDWTLLQFITHRAPPGDHNDPEVYAKFVANRCRCTIETTLGQLFS